MLLMAALLLQPWPSMQMIYRSHWLSRTGGLFGAIYIAISILLLPRLGAATVIALIVAGQMIGSLAFDQFGLLGVPVHPLNMFRLAGAALLVLGAILVRLWQNPPCPLWVRSCRANQPEARPLYPRKLPRLSPTGAAVKGHNRTRGKKQNLLAQGAFRCCALTSIRNLKIRNSKQDNRR